VIMGKVLCVVAADAMDEKRIKNKIKAADTEIIERNSFLLFICAPSLLFLFQYNVLML
jgi:hypothetical protein